MTVYCGNVWSYYMEYPEGMHFPKSVYAQDWPFCFSGIIHSILILNTLYSFYKFPFLYTPVYYNDL